MVLFNQTSRRISKILGVSAGAILACVTIGFVVVQQDRLRAGAWVRHTWQTIAKIEAVKNDLYELRLAQKDSAITGNKKTDEQKERQAYLDFFQDLGELQELIADNKKQVERLSKIKKLFILGTIEPIQKLLEESAAEEVFLLKSRVEWFEKANILLSFSSGSLAIAFLATLSTNQYLAKKNVSLVKKQTTAIAELIHDLRNPITGISSGLEVLARRATQEKPAIDRLLNLCQLMNELLSDIRFLNAESIEVLPQTENVQEFCNLLTDNINSIYSRKCQKVVFGCVAEEQETFLVSFDKELIRRVLYNLISNAIAYSPENVQVTFKAAITAKYLTFSVADSGIGIPQRDRAKLFEPFKRGSNVGGRQGTGLGLAIAYQCTKACGGKIWFEDRMPSGTVFFVQLPKNSRHADLADR